MKQGILVKIGVFYIIAIVSLGWGVAIGAYKVFPWKYINQAIGFITGDSFEKTTLLEKIQSDFTSVPKRFLHPIVDNNLQIITNEVSSSAFADSRLPPTYYSDKNEGYYLIYGIMEFSENRYGALVISSQGEIRNTWHFDVPPGETLNPVKGGFDHATGTLYSNVGKALTAYNFCGEELYQLDGVDAHHSIEGAGDGTIWMFDSLYFDHRKERTGELIRRISILDIMMANPELSIFEARLAQNDWFYNELPSVEMVPVQEIPSLTLKETNDPFHFNDISPLSKELAPFYPSLDVGDLLVSSRALNLVFIFDPKTYKIKKYLYGRTSRQHDPDYSVLGKISIFDNQNHKSYSRIVSWDIDSDEIETIFDGADINLSNEAHGNYSILNDESLVFVDYHGRIYHFDKSNEVLFFFENRFDLKSNMELRNVWYISDKDYEQFNQACIDN